MDLRSRTPTENRGLPLFIEGGLDLLSEFRIPRRPISEKGGDGSPQQNADRKPRTPPFQKGDQGGLGLLSDDRCRHKKRE